MHYTIYPDALTKQRVRASLGTKSVNEARRRRDAILADFKRVAPVIRLLDS